MDAKTALKRFNEQKRRATERGIGWELTLHQWCEWWGNDIDRRGCRADQLSMQRVGDVGPYALWNIRKGYPRDNSATRSKMHSKHKSDAAGELIAFLQRALRPKIDQGDHDDMSLSDDERFFANMGKVRSSFSRFTTDRE